MTEKTFIYHNFHQVESHNNFKQIRILVKN